MDSEVHKIFAVQGPGRPIALHKLRTRPKR